MTLGIVIPWRPQPSRLEAFEFIYAHYREMFPDSPIYLSDVPSERFNISAARNVGCIQAFYDGCDVVIVADADTYVEKYELEKSAERAVEFEVIVLAYSDLRLLDASTSTSLMKKEIAPVDAARVSPALYNQVAGVYVLTEATFWKLNGWDQRFEGWGYEDLAIEKAHKVILGRNYIRTYGKALSLNHVDRDVDLLDTNRLRFNAYDAIVDVQEMRTMIEENMDSLK